MLHRISYDNPSISGWQEWDGGQQGGINGGIPDYISRISILIIAIAQLLKTWRKESRFISSSDYTRPYMLARCSTAI